MQEQRAYLRAFYARQRTPSRSFSGAIRMGRQSLLDQYAAAVRYFNPHLPESKARTIAGHVIWYSQVNGVDARLVMAVIAVESGFDNRARSNKGAMGLGQLMPGTAKDLGVVNPYDPEQNIAGAVRLIRWNLSEFGNDDLALACYNAGENAVKRHHGIPPYQETIHYIQRVEELYHAMCRGGG